MTGWYRIPSGCGRKWLTALFWVLVITMTVTADLEAEPDQVKAVVLAHWPPQYQTDDFGRPTGFAVDVLEHVAASMDMNVRYEIVDSWEEMFAAVQGGHADLIPNQGITAERKEWFAFTAPVETFQVVIFVRQTTSHIRSAADLRSHVVGTVKYKVGTRLMKERYDIEHRIFPNLKEAFWELLAGRVDALIYPQPVMMKFAMDAGLEGHVKVVGEPLVEIKRGISVHKDNTVLLQRLSPAVENFISTAEYQRVYTKWYGEPRPYWTARRILWLMGGLIFFAVVLHAFRVNKVNRQLKRSISGRRKAEAALKRSEEKYRLIVENQSDLTVKLDGRGEIQFTSPNFCDALGMSKEDYMKRPFLSLVNTGDRKEVKLAMQSLQVAPHACRFDGRSLTPKGWRWFSWSCKAIVEDNGSVKEVIAVGRDTTERKTAEGRLQESEEKFRAIFEQAAEAVVLLNIETLSVSDFNAAAYHSLGYTRLEFKGIRLEDLVVVSPGETISDAINNTIQSGQEAVETVMLTKSGQMRHFLTRHRPLAVNGGKYLLGIWLDISDRKMLEENLVQSQKMEAIGTLAGGVAHDFNNILSIIIGNTELAMHDISKGDPAKGRLDEIQIAGNRAKEVVRQLLSFSRRGQENRLPVQLVSLVEESLTLLRATIPATIEIQKRILSKDLPLMADPTQIHQILINLCNNAAQAMAADGGTIEVTLGHICLDGRTAERYGVKAGTYAQIGVEDTGCGISAQNIDRIFDPYFTTKPANEGTGMGLSIVHGIATRHDGAVDVDSRLGEGTVFNVLLPLSKDIRPSAIDVDDVICTGTGTVLLVDDEPSIMELGRSYLDKLGYAVRAHRDATEAFSEFKANPSDFDLIVTDMTMPKMTGEALAKAVLKIRPDIPIILCSGYHGKVDAESVRSMGINLFLQKPYNLKVLAGAVHKALGANIDNPLR